MNNKEVMVYKESFISKIKKFFKDLFGNKKQDNSSIKITSDEKKINKREEDFFKDIRFETDIHSITGINKNDFLQEVHGNIEALNMLSIDRLRKLEKYYEEVIKQNDIKIKKLKSSI